MSTNNNGRFIDCPVCEAAWDISCITQCDCGAKIIFAEPGEELEYLCPSSKPEIGLRWVKASERRPPKHGPLVIVRNILYPETIVQKNNLGHETHWGQGYDDWMFDDTEWLEEINQSGSIPSSEPAKESQPTVDFVKFLDWWLLNYMGVKGATPNSTTIVVDRYLSQSTELK